MLSFRHRIAAAIQGLAAIVVSAILIAFVSLTPAVAIGAVSITQFLIPGTQPSFPWGTAFDPEGRVWVALPGCDVPGGCVVLQGPGRLARFDPATHQFSTTVSLPTGFGQPLFVAVTPQGKVWFTMPLTNSIGEYDPSSRTLAQWSVPLTGAEPWDLALDQSGEIWFTEHAVNKIASFDPRTNRFRQISTPTAGSDPYGIAVDESGNVWFTENPDSVAKIGEYTTGGQVLEFKVRNGLTGGSGLTPHLIIVDPDGNPWWSEGFAEGVGTLNVDQAKPGTNDGVTEHLYSLPFLGHTSGIAYNDGRIWFDDSNRNKIGFLPVEGGSFTFFNSVGNHPHDGLNVDGLGRVWFDNEFSNTLAETNSTNGNQNDNGQQGDTNGQQ
jgi:streptogramin lyase